VRGQPRAGREKRRNRLRITVLLAAAVFALGGASAAKAERAVHLNGLYDFSGSFTDSSLCGFPITVTSSGSYDITLVYNDAGLVIREIDTTPAAKTTFSSASGSFTYPVSFVARTTYPGGATVGLRVDVTSTGLFGPRVTGAGTMSGTAAGIQFFSGAVVTGFTPEGIPIVDTRGATFTFRGTGPSGDELDADICAALSP
jgi:hypothetical protein